MPHETVYQLREAFRDYVAKDAPHIDSFCGEALFADHKTVDLPPTQLPMFDELPNVAGLGEVSTQPIVDAVLAAAPHLCWRRSYTLEDEGIDQNHLDHNGWFNLIAPSGPFVSEELRLGIGYWGKGLRYPRHWHEPEEIYLTLAGSLIYHSEGRASVEGGPGSSICHYSNQPHSADFSISPALVAGFWRGNGLETKSVIGEV